MDVSIIIVSYNTVELTAAAVESVYKETKKLSFEIILVDNASTDGSADFIEERFPGVKLVKLGYNAGFAGANNLASKQARGRYVLLLNPDTVILDGAVDILVSWADANPEWGIYGGSTFFPDGSRNPTSGRMKATVWNMFCIAWGLARIFRRSRLFNSQSLETWDWESPRRVDTVTGCLLMMRRKDWNLLGGFDPRFFMYGEDADLCLRASAVGLPAILVPQSRIIHYGGASEPVRSDKMVRLFRAKVQLFRLHYNLVKATVLIAMLQQWCLVRIVVFGAASIFKPELKEKLLQWTEIWKRRCDWLDFPSGRKQF